MKSWCLFVAAAAAILGGCGTSVREGASGRTKGWTGQRGDARRRSEQPTRKPIGPLRPALQRRCSQEIGSRGHPLSRNRRTS
jgi:hypothetical protein